MIGSMESQIDAGLRTVSKTSRKLIGLSDAEVKEILNKVAYLALAKRKEILAANALDLARMDPENPKYDRLLLNEARLGGIASDMRSVADLPSPLNELLEEKVMENGLNISRVSVPIGVIGIVYESRPNVTFDVFSLCLKSGNACVLKGSRDAHDSNIAIVNVIHEVLSEYGLEDILFLAPSEREALGHILSLDDYIDCVIPRGSQGLINFVRENSKVPVIETGAGIVHTYVDDEADLSKAKAIIQNAKCRRVSVCNALDCLIIHENRLGDLPEIMEVMDKQFNVEVFADQQSYDALKDSYQDSLLFKAREEDFGVEWLAHKMSIKTVSSFEEALDHIAIFSSKHSEAIVTENKATQGRI